MLFVESIYQNTCTENVAQIGRILPVVPRSSFTESVSCYAERNFMSLDRSNKITETHT